MLQAWRSEAIRGIYFEMPLHLAKTHMCLLFLILFFLSFSAPSQLATSNLSSGQEIRELSCCHSPCQHQVSYLAMNTGLVWHWPSLVFFSRFLFFLKSVLENLSLIYGERWKCNFRHVFCCSLAISVAQMNTSPCSAKWSNQKCWSLSVLHVRWFEKFRSKEEIQIILNFSRWITKCNMAHALQTGRCPSGHIWKLDEKEL